MCIEFYKSQGECDILSSLANLIGNTATAVVGGTALASIAFVALNALGYEALTAAAFAAVVPFIPVSIAAFGALPILGGIAAAGTAIALMVYLCSVRTDPEPEAEEI